MPAPREATIENTYSKYGPITYQLRRFADRRFPQDWPRDLLAQLVDFAYLLEEDTSRGTRFKDEETEDGFVAQLVIEHGRGILPTVVWQIDSNPIRRRITTSRPGKKGTPQFVRCHFDGSGRVFRLTEIAIAPETGTPELAINTDWSSPSALIEIPSADSITPDFLMRQGDLEVRAAEDPAKLVVATLDGDPFTIPVNWDMSQVG